jgi:hypothetical protein
MISAAALAELKAEASYAAERLALYRRRMLMGNGEPRVLAERERIAAGAAERVKRAEAGGD